MTTQNADIVRDAVALAESWQRKANEIITKEETAIQKQMKRLVTTPKDKVILTKLMDQSFRTESNRRVADQVNYVLKRFGVPKFFTLPEKGLMQLFLNVGRHMPSISVPRMIEKMRADSARAIIPGEPEILFEHLKKRREEGVRMNINHIGEAVLGEGEAESRLADYLKDLEHPEIEYISVKISTIYSQISSLALDHTVSVLKDRLSKLYRTAAANEFERKDGTRTPKFVNLDMEEYRDLEITVKAFRETLDEPEFTDHAAGIVLQAYLPDSTPIQHELTEWAKKRVENGGAPIKIRIVKGANMEMEEVESSIQNWPLAPYDNKKDVDANFKRMVDYGCIPENMKAVRLGIASHNLFDLAYAYQTAKSNDVMFGFSFEMLEGMADHIRRAIQEISGDVLLYAPVAARDQFINAIAYLIRRLDENTAEENFLRRSFDLAVGSEDWRFLKDQFAEAVDHKDKARKSPNRVQDRNTETFSETIGTFYQNEFLNEPDTDWAVAANRKWAEGIRDKWMIDSGGTPVDIPIVVGGEELTENRDRKEYHDPSRIHQEKIHVATFTLGNPEDADRAVAVAKADPDGWRDKTFEERNEILARAAMNIRNIRGDLIGAAAANTGKVFTEADPEVSEAIDFTELYPFTAKKFADMPNLKASGKGVGVVVSPWNFPIAIPCGGVAAVLASGNTVIFKPSSDAVMTAWILCNCFWDAGVSKNTLQFMPCGGSKVGGRLVANEDVDFVILTGGTDTGLKMLETRPDMFLCAETGGKNATIVTAMSDRDQAIKNIIHSAFSNCGQKCSATSLLILEKEVYEDENFKRQLIDAAKSYSVGSAWMFRNRMGTLIHPPSGDLKRAQTELEPGEEWALKPEMVEGNPYMWSPGIKWNVKAGSYTHMTEFFGPLIGVMCAKDLDHAVRMVNQTGYGLTSSLESLDQREHERWKSAVRAGNLYINKGSTGAVVLRQPFGGMGKSALGAGIKAGGPNYVSQFMKFEEIAPPMHGAIGQDHWLLRAVEEMRLKFKRNAFDGFRDDIEKTIRAVKSYLYAYENEFSREKDYFHLRGQDNLVRYLPIGSVMVCLHENDTLFDVLGRICAVQISGCRLLINIPPGMDNAVTQFLMGREGDRILKTRPPIRKLDNKGITAELKRVDRMRYAAHDRVPHELFVEAAKTGAYISRTNVMMEGGIELLQYFREQAVCNSYHRYGNLGERTDI